MTETEPAMKGEGACVVEPQRGDLREEGGTDHFRSFLSVLAGLQRGRSLEDVARELHISAEALECWINGLGLLASVYGTSASGENSPERSELKRLRAENAYLRQQRDLYRRACGIVGPVVGTEV